MFPCGSATLNLPDLYEREISNVGQKGAVEGFGLALVCVLNAREMFCQDLSDMF